jgi:biopolymer transport protein ExbD
VDGSFDTGLGSHAHEREAMSEINTTPLVDVMLVLLVIFIITAPLFTHAIELALPDAKAPALEAQRVPVTISIDAAGQVYWNQQALSDALFAQRCIDVAKGSEPPDLQLRADKATRYERVAFVMSAAQDAGLNRLAFVTEPAVPHTAAGASR